jgi:hypothetical protein
MTSLPSTDEAFVPRGLLGWIRLAWKHLSMIVYYYASIDASPHASNGKLQSTSILLQTVLAIKSSLLGGKFIQGIAAWWTLWTQSMKRKVTRN